MPYQEDPLARYGRPLAAAMIAVVISVIVAALIGGAMPFDYAGRAWTYAGLVLYILAGAFVVLRAAAAGESQAAGAFTLRRILTWTVSVWLWPLLAVRRAKRPPPPA